MIWLRLPIISDALSFNAGVYLLAAELEREHRLRIGRLGRHLFPKGTYLYVGSAQRNLRQRLNRHISAHHTNKKLHWHIDYLLTRARVRFALAFNASREWECRLGGYVAMLAGSRMALKGFGSSDCDCETHLYCFPDISKAEVQRILQDAVRCLEQQNIETLRYAQGDRVVVLCRSEYASGG